MTHARSTPALTWPLRRFTGDYSIPFKIFSHVTSAQTILNDPESAPSEIDRVLSVCLTKLSPVYISLPAYALLLFFTPPPTCNSHHLVALVISATPSALRPTPTSRYVPAPALMVLSVAQRH